MSWLERLATGAPVPVGLQAWAATLADPAEAWARCERPDWRVWIAAQLPLDEDEQRKVLRAAEHIEPLGETLTWRQILRPTPSPFEIACRVGRRRNMELDATDYLLAWGLAYLFG